MWNNLEITYIHTSFPERLKKTDNRMAQKRWLGVLPSDVEEDSDLGSEVDSRVPTLGLQHHPWGKQQQDSRCDSGVFDSFASGTSSVRSSYGYTVTDAGLDSIDETSLHDKLKNLSLQQQQQHTSERLPSVDEGFFSTDQKEESLTPLNKPSRIVFPPELPKEVEPQAKEDEDYIDDRILDIFLQDDEGDT